MHVSSGFHDADSAHVDHLHQGIDFAVPLGTPVHSFHAGVVAKVTHEGAKGFGDAVWVRFTDGHTAVFGHLHNVFVRAGDKVRDNDIIGTSGNSGHSTGPHLHLGIMDAKGRWIDPNVYLHVHNAMAIPFGPSVTQTHDPSLVPTPDSVTQWKDQVETWGQQLFGIPRGVWHAGTPSAHVIDPQNAFTQALIQLFEGVGKASLHAGPGILTVVCLGSILGAMLGSMRCRHWAGVSALGTVVVKVMDNYVGV